VTSESVEVGNTSHIDSFQQRRNQAVLPRIGMPFWVPVIVGSIGLLLTGSVAWTAWSLNRSNEHRLLDVQTRQASAVIASTILNIRSPLATVVQVEAVTGGDRREFDRFMTRYVGPHSTFISASLWKAGGSSAHLLATVGVAPALPPASKRAHDFIARAFHTATFVVSGVPESSPRRIGYALADPQNPTFAVYAERAIPANRQVAVESGSAFSDLNFATYLGPSIRASNLATTDVPETQLPLAGDVDRVQVPFGDLTLTLVTTARVPLGGSLGGDLPWMFLIGGLLLTLGPLRPSQCPLPGTARDRRDAPACAPSRPTSFGPGIGDCGAVRAGSRRARRRRRLVQRGIDR
jgi:hypothetical protein